eukprot:6475571-Amphidinium_carterae.1
MGIVPGWGASMFVLNFVSKSILSEFDWLTSYVLGSQLDQIVLYFGPPCVLTKNISLQDAPRKRIHTYSTVLLPANVY